MASEGKPSGPERRWIAQALGAFVRHTAERLKIGPTELKLREIATVEVLIHIVMI